jgi:hypothetical protein
MDKLPTSEDWQAMIDKAGSQERVMSAQWFNGKMYIFTPNMVYIARKIRWYHRAWYRIQSAFWTVARKLKGLGR